MPTAVERLSLNAEEADFLDAYAALPAHMRNFVRNGIDVFISNNRSMWDPETLALANRVQTLLVEGCADVR